MGNKKKNDPIDGTSKANLPLEPIPLYAKMAETGQTNADTIKKGPDFPTDLPVQGCVAVVETCVKNLKKTISGLDDAHTAIALLEPQRTKDAAALHRANDALASAVTTSTGGVRDKIVAYGAKLAGHTASVPSTEAPTLVRGSSKPGTHSATFRCKADSRAVCYHYAWGTEPGNPDAWTTTAVEGGATHVVPGPLPVGQKLYFRMAIQRRKTGLGAWSGVVEVTIR